MFKHLLVPLDGSELAEAALPVANELAHKLQASVTLFHVIEKNVPAKVHGEKHLSNIQEAELYLNQIKRTVFTQNVTVDFHIHSTEIEKVASSIVEHEKEFSFDLIVMCSHGRSGAGHLLFGSIAQQVIGLGIIPVLMIRPIKQKRQKQFFCHSILLPIDIQQKHWHVVEVAGKFAKSCSAHIHLLTVIETFHTLSGKWTATSKYLPGTTSKMLDMAVNNTEKNLQEQAAIFHSEDLEVSTEILRGDPATVIVKTAETRNVDIIALGTHGKSGISAFWGGSVTNKVCSLCQRPLLLVPNL